MKLRMTFLGTGSAFTVGTGNFQSNVLLSFDNESLLIDAGTDLRHSLYEQSRSFLDIRTIFITHLHTDHCGGLEWLALTSYFDTRYTGMPRLFVPKSLVDDLWNKSLAAGLSTLEPIEATLDTYFQVTAVDEQKGFIWKNIAFELVAMTHFCSNHKLMPTFGLFFEYNGQRVFFTSDTQYTPDALMPYFKKADIIFHDCEILSKPSGVHAHYKQLVMLPENIKKKLWLYHYNPMPLPDAAADGFAGFVSKGQVFEF